MKSVDLGKTGVRVSAVCLGAMRFGSQTDETRSFQMLDAYAEAGGTFIDTANVYACWVPGCKGGESEALLGRWMKARRNRDRVFLATKTGSRLQGSGRGLQPAQIRMELDASLARLQTDRVDLLYSHFDDPNTPIAETMVTYAETIRAGRVRFLGASNFRAWRLGEVRQACEKLDLQNYVCVQQRYSYAQPVAGASFGVQVAANEDLVEYCRQYNLTLLAYSPLLGGVYGGRTDKEFDLPYRSVRNEKRIDVLKAVAREKGVTPNQVVLAWMLCMQPPVIPLLGTGNVDQLKENIAALDVRLTPDEMDRLDKSGA